MYFSMSNMKQIAKGRLLLRYSRTNFNATNWHLCDYCCHFHTMTMWLTVYETQLDKFSHIFLGSLRLDFHASFKFLQRRKYNWNFPIFFKSPSLTTWAQFYITFLSVVYGFSYNASVCPRQAFLA